MNSPKKKVAFHTLGCKLNFAETSTIARSLPEDQFEKVPSNKHADIYIINTCSVTDAADKKCRQAIKHFIKQAPEAIIAVVGCYAQLNPVKISSIPGVDLILGTNEKFDLAGYLDNRNKGLSAEIHSCHPDSGNSFFPASSVGERTRSFLKIQDGCDYKCSYCTIPMARGSSRSPSVEMLVREANRLADFGVKEAVLTGVNIGDFGKESGTSLYQLLSELVKVRGIERFRISSIEPNLLTDELIGLAAKEPKILPHFHIPLQSGSDRILGLMKRRYQRQLFSDVVNSIRKAIPVAGIGADVIVGFPGESDSDFEDTCNFLQDQPVSYLHVFNFSTRPGTPAATMPEKVQSGTREQRSKRLILLSDNKHLEFCKLNIGLEASVLFEHKRTGDMITGFTGNYLKTEYQWQTALEGEIRKMRLTGISGPGRMAGEFID
ncbi:MAG: tRNA (N(6)-L-threonylcarbamoyladenosine(37)-C(2))-methylthiotransferase MtaB [Bacteroidales bacterium]